MRKRKLLLGAVVALVGAVAFALCAWPYRIARGNYDRIKQGMSAAEVEAILGPAPPVDFQDDGLSVDDFDAEAAQSFGQIPDLAGQSLHAHTWPGRAGYLMIVFDHGHVVYKEWAPRATLLQRLQSQWRRWFP